MRHRFPPPFAQPVRGQHEGDRFPRGSLLQCVCRQRAFGCVLWHILDHQFPATVPPGVRRPDGKEVWRWVAYHMVKSGRKDDLRRLLLDLNYLEAKLFATNTNALIADYDYLPENKDLRTVQSAIRLSSHVLVRDCRQLAGQLTGRLLGNKTPSIQ